MNYKSQFGYIIDLLEISGKELASTINVDRTLVSKWKNNARPLKVNNPHFNNILEALISFNHKRNDAIFERFFREVYPNIDRNEPDYLSTCLTTWLIGKDLGYFNSFNDWRRAKSSLYTTTIDIYKGNQGKRDAAIEFFNYALELPSGQEIFISDTEKMDWLTEDMEFYALYHIKLNELAQKGHNIIIIYNLTYGEKRVGAFDYFGLSKYFTGKVTAYGLEQFTAPIPSLYIIHRHMLLMSFDNEIKNDDLYIAVYRDPFSIEQMVKEFSQRLNQSKKLISTYSSHGTSLKGFTETLMSAIQERSTSYFLSPLPPFSTMPDALLQDILHNNNLSDQQMYELMQIHKVNKKMFFKNGNQSLLEEIISQEHLERALTSDLIRLDDVSSITNKDIYITREQLIEHLKYLDSLITTHDYFNISVASFHDLPILTDSMMWIIEEQMIYSYPLCGETNFIISDSEFILEKAVDHIKNLLMLNEEAKTLHQYLKGLS